MAESKKTIHDVIAEIGSNPYLNTKRIIPDLRRISAFLVNIYRNPNLVIPQELFTTLYELFEKFGKSVDILLFGSAYRAQLKTSVSKTKTKHENAASIISGRNQLIYNLSRTYKDITEFKEIIIRFLISLMKLISKYLQKITKPDPKQTKPTQQEDYLQYQIIKEFIDKFDDECTKKILVLVPAVLIYKNDHEKPIQIYIESLHFFAKRYNQFQCENEKCYPLVTDVSEDDMVKKLAECINIIDVEYQKREERRKKDRKDSEDYVIRDHVSVSGGITDRVYVDTYTFGLNIFPINFPDKPQTKFLNSLRMKRSDIEVPKSISIRDADAMKKGRFSIELYQIDFGKAYHEIKKGNKIISIETQRIEEAKQNNKYHKFDTTCFANMDTVRNKYNYTFNINVIYNSFSEYLRKHISIFTVIENHKNHKNHIKTATNQILLITTEDNGEQRKIEDYLINFKD